jgi:DNA-binding CsgD family transcriptional regulator/tetratricopeptide (TPR) repeat protein
MLIGRERESARIEQVLDAARSQRSSSLVVKGEAGIGKSALLADAVERAGDMRVLRALGVESEVDIAFSGLHELLRPALGSLAALTDSQADALRAALALGAHSGGDRLAVYSGALSLLAAVADDRPVLCVVDDAHWLDAESASALTFVARRLDADGIAMLFGVREPEVRSFAAPGIAELEVRALDAAASRHLLTSLLPAGAAPLVLEQLLDVALGNPLALVELSARLTPAQLAGDSPLQEPLGSTPSVERGFLRRLARLQTRTRRALGVAAASDIGDAESLSAAFESLDLTLRDLRPAEEAGLLTVGSTVAFSHPLARSAIYAATTEPERNEAHLALAAAAEAAGEPDRRAWHLAAAARDRDEDVASALVETAESARRRGGVWSEAKALERAARLTPDPRQHARRLAGAGLAAYRAGRLDRAAALLDEAVAGELAPTDFAHAQSRRAHIHFDRGDFDSALELMVGGAQDLETVDVRAAGILLTNAATVAQHRLEVARADVLAERAWELAGDGALDDAELCHVVSFQRLQAGRVRDAMSVTRRCADLVADGSEREVVVADAASTLLYSGELESSRPLFERAVERSRRAGATSDLGYALHMAAQLDWYSGDLEPAYAKALEAVQIVAALDTAQMLDDCLARLATFEAVLGREEDSRRHATRALASALRLGDRRNEVRARGALGLLGLTTGDLESAVSQLAPAVAALDRGGHRNPNQIRVAPDLVEAYTRLGNKRVAAPVVASLESGAAQTEISWTRAAALRCRGLVAEDDGTALGAFEAARGIAEASAFERARTDLCYGERLRRAGRRRDGRLHLGAALEGFEATGAVPFAERASNELRASGLTPRKREPTGRERLTAQELQIARLVAEGKTNRDVAAILFVSPKTVEFHLTRVYRKLDIRSRTELVRRMLAREPS